MKHINRFRQIAALLLTAVLLAGAFSGCTKEEELQTEEATAAVCITPQETEPEEEVLPMCTAMGITVPQNLGQIGISIYDCTNFEGPLITQDGSWKWIDAEDTTPQRGDLILYRNNEVYEATHEAICVYSYTDGVYMNIDGNYDVEPGGLWKGRFDTGEPNKSWPDSYPKYPETEYALGVWRSTNPDYAEMMAKAAEAVYEEYQIIGQENFLKKYIPELYYGVWCYYLIPIAVNAVAQNKIDVGQMQKSEETAAEAPVTSSTADTQTGDGLETP